MKLHSVRAAQQRILRRMRPVQAELLPLEDCAGRVLAQGVRASDLPAFDNSSVDGFAVIGSDLIGAKRSQPRSLHVVADIPAGRESAVGLKHGQAARIMTGAPTPRGADAVVMIENTDSEARSASADAPDTVRVFRAPEIGENIRIRGMDVRRGQEVLHRGHRLRPQDLGMLAMLGVANAPVIRRPRVALLSSGDELVPVGRPLEPGKIRDSNSYTLRCLITEAGCEVIPLGIAPDDKRAIQRRLDRALKLSADLIISSAGVSVGAFDLVRDVIGSRGHLDFWKVNVRPGKPLAVGAYGRVPFIGLPGNPVSAFVGFELFVRPALARLSGLILAPRRRLAATIDVAVKSDGRESYLRSIVQERNGSLHAKLTGHQGSGNLLSLVQANALLIIPAGVKSLPVGARVDVWLL